MGLLGIADDEGRAPGQPGLVGTKGRERPPRV